MERSWSPHKAERGWTGMGSPNNPVKLTAHSAGFVVVPVLGACGPQLTRSVRPANTIQEEGHHDG